MRTDSDGNFRPGYNPSQPAASVSDAIPACAAQIFHAAIQETDLLGENLSRFPILPENGQVVLYVHGFTETYGSAHRHSSSLRVIYEDSIPVISFLWPCHTKVGNYLAGRKNAATAGGRLRRALKLLLARGNKVHIVAHSLGCRVVLSALHKSGLWQYAQGKIGTVVLAAAAVPSDALSSDGEFAAELVPAERLLVLYCRNDEILRKAYAAAEVIPALLDLKSPAAAALGVEGPDARQAPVDERVSSVDVSETVKEHFIGAYLESAQVASVLFKIVQQPQASMEVDKSMLSECNKLPPSPDAWTSVASTSVDTLAWGCIAEQ